MTHRTGPTDAPSLDLLLHPTWVRWRVVALLLAFSFLSWFNRVSMAVAYDEQIQRELHISEAAMGYVYSAFLFAYMLFMTPGGWLADRFGPRLALALMGFGSAAFGALTGAVGLVLLAPATVLVLFLVVRAVMGVFTAPIYPASGRALMHWLPPRQRAAANGAVMGAALLGIAGTYFGFGVLMDWFGWPTAFAITGAVTGLLALLWTVYATDWPWQHPGVNGAELHWIRSGKGAETAEPQKADGARPSVWRTLLGNRSLMLLTVSYAAVGYFEYLSYFWMHYYFDKVLHRSKEESRAFTTVLFLAMAAGMFAGGGLSDFLQRSWGRRRARAVVAAGGMLAGAAFLGLGFYAAELGWVVLWLALALAAVGATEGPLWATALELGGRHGGTAAGIFNTGGNAGGVVAPVVTPLVSAAFNWKWGIGLGGVVCLAGGLLWFWIDADESEGRPGVVDGAG